MNNYLRTVVVVTALGAAPLASADSLRQWTLRYQSEISHLSAQTGCSNSAYFYNLPSPGEVLAYRATLQGQLEQSGFLNAFVFTNERYNDRPVYVDLRDGAIFTIPDATDNDNFRAALFCLCSSSLTYSDNCAESSSLPRLGYPFLAEADGDDTPDEPESWFDSVRNEEWIYASSLSSFAGARSACTRRGFNLPSATKLQSIKDELAASPLGELVLASDRRSIWTRDEFDSAHGLSLVLPSGALVAANKDYATHVFCFRPVQTDK
jgi:hypothetical protein